MNTLLWILQGLAAVLYGTSGIMKVFLFDRIRDEVASFGALPRSVWMALGVVELLCVVGLLAPAIVRGRPRLPVYAAAVLAVESLVFIGVHAKYGEIASIVMSGMLGLLMAYIAYARAAVRPVP